MCHVTRDVDNDRCNPTCVFKGDKFSQIRYIYTPGCPGCGPSDTTQEQDSPRID